MKRPSSVDALNELGRVRLSKSFFMRDFLFSEIAAINGMANVPDDPDLAIAAGTRLCTDLLEPLQDTFGRIAIRSAYRSAEVNAFGNAKKLNCASNEANRAAHIWDLRDADGCMGAVACVQVPSFNDRFTNDADWTKLAWWIHDHLPYSTLEFFSTKWAFNIGWHERPKRTIHSWYRPGPRLLTKPGMANHDGSHTAEWADLNQILKAGNERDGQDFR